MTDTGPSPRVCLVPARGGSQRLPGKNTMVIGGVPLVGRAVRVAHESGLFDAVYVSTDDPEIARVAEEYGARVPGLRPEHLAGATASLVDVSLHVLDHLGAEGKCFEDLCLLMPTSPLRTAADVTDSYRLYRTSGSAFLMSVTSYVMGSPYWALEMGDRGRLARRFGPEYFADGRDDANVVCPSGVVRWVDVAAFRREKTFYGTDLVGYRVPALRAVEIDEAAEAELAEALLFWNEHGPATRSDVGGGDA